MYTHLKINTLLIAFFAFLTFSCKKEKPDEEKPFDSFSEYNKKEMLSDIRENVNDGN